MINKSWLRPSLSQCFHIMASIYVMRTSCFESQDNLIGQGITWLGVETMIGTGH